MNIATILSKLFETCLFARHKDKLGSSGLQFGFVQGCGCDKSIFTLSNVVSYYLERSSDVYEVNLDVDAAFDRLNTYELRNVLIKRG